MDEGNNDGNDEDDENHDHADHRGMRLFVDLGGCLACYPLTFSSPDCSLVKCRMLMDLFVRPLLNYLVAKSQPLPLNSDYLFSLALRAIMKCLLS